MATYRWIGGSGGFDAASSWQVLQNGVFVTATTAPSSTDLAEIETGATISGNGAAQELAFDALTTISGTDDIATYSIISDSAAADVFVATQWSDSSSLIIGEAAAGTLTLLADATVEIGGSLVAGFEAGSSGTLVIDAGATLYVNGPNGVLGGPAGAHGAAFISGAGADWALAGQLTVGSNGTAYMAITNGGSVGSNGEYDAIGVFRGGSGTVLVDGKNSFWCSEDEIAVGCTGDGTLVISNGGEVMSEDITGVALGNGTGTLLIESGGLLTSNGENAVVGEGSSGSGAVTITGPDSTWTMTSNLAVGLTEAGQVSIGAGGTLASGGTNDVVGSAEGAVGKVSISGAGALMTTPGQLAVGLNGTGDVTITDGGSLFTGGWYNGIGVATGGIGSVVVDGAGSEWTSEWQIAVGCTGDGTLIISDDATVISDDITGVALTGGGTGTLTIESGGLLSSAGASAAVGDATGGAGLVTITGPSSTWRMTSNLGVSAGETGRIEVADGGTLATNGTLAILGALAGAGGTVDVDGAGSNWQNAGQIVIGGTGTGTLEIGAGAWVSAETADINGTGSLDLTGGTFAVATATSLNFGALLTGTGTLATSIFNFGTIAATGALTFEDQVQGSGVFDIGTAGDAIFETSVLAGTTIDFVGRPGRLDLESPADFSGTVVNFDGGDTIFAAGASSISFGGGDLITLLDSGGDSVGTIQLAGSYAAGSLVDNDGTITDLIACFVTGTRIATPGGEVAVERLQIGDQVVTNSGAARPVKWIGRRSYGGRFIAGRRDVLPITVAAGALADGVPVRDLTLSPKHALFLDGMLIPAERLVNGRTIIQCAAVAEVCYHHVELNGHDILLADGAPAESFIDLDSRLMFENAAEFLALYAGSAAAPVACAPRIEEGEALQAVRRRLARRAGLASDHAADATVPGALDGRIDEFDVDHVAGWAFDVGRPHTPVQIEILVDGAVVARCTADRFRADLRRAGMGQGRCAFMCRLPVALTDGAAHVMEVRRAEDRRVVAGVGLPAQPIEPGPLDGRVDLCGRAGVEGWALDVAWPGVPVQLEVLDGRRIIGTTLANRHRPDLERAGKGDGRCSFVFRFDTLPRDLSRIRVRRASDGSLLRALRVHRPAA